GRGGHPYSGGEGEGRGVPDAAGAAKNLADPHANDDVLVFGHSQGGQSALFAGELAASYAPELNVLGVAAAAPAADVEQILPLAAGISGGAGGLGTGLPGVPPPYPHPRPASLLSPPPAAQRRAPPPPHPPP